MARKPPAGSFIIMRSSVLISTWACAILGAVSPSLAFAQTADRGGIAIRRGVDTLVIDRFIRVADTLKGSVQVKGQPRIDYFARLGPNETVQTLTLAVFAIGATADAQPLQRVRVPMHNDSAVVETAAGTQRVLSRTGAIPSFNNALALSELFTRRARAAGGVADVPYFAINGGVTLDVRVRPIGTDSMSVTIAQQLERLSVDPTGRILGGVIVGANFEFVRLGPEAAVGLVVSIRDTTVAPSVDCACRDLAGLRSAGRSRFQRTHASRGRWW